MAVSELQSNSLASAHASLPKWFAIYQRTCGLSFLVLCTAYLFGKLGTTGLIDNVASVFGADWFRQIGVVVFFLGGTTIAGIALTCSIAFVKAISGGRSLASFVTALFSLVGMVIFFGMEVWASLSERSLEYIARPLDTLVMTRFGWTGPVVFSPTLLAAALLIPMGTLFYGFTQVGHERADIQAIEDDQIKQTRELQKAEFEAKLAAARAKTNAARASGLVGTFNAARDAATRRPDAVADEVGADFQ